jgi:glutamate/tyrosine decarboxylase-like PLP-dependent enzyme
MKKLLRETAERAIRYLEECRDRRVSPEPSSLSRLGSADDDLPEDPSDPRATLELLDEIYTPATVAKNGGRYFGFVTGGVLPAALAADWMVSVWDQDAKLEIEAPGAIHLERQALEWVRGLLGLPGGTGGGFVTGATMANFSCLAAARRQLLLGEGWDLDAAGLFEAPRVKVVVGDEVHVSVLKALRLLGFGADQLIRVPVDDQGRMSVDALPSISGPVIVCLQAGNVNTGASDSFSEIIDALQGDKAWVHIDGAFGLWAAASPERRSLVAGVERADSWATDAHKWLNVPYDCGISLVRDPVALAGALSISAAYLPEGDHIEPLHVTPEASRRARGMPVWAALRSLGRDGVAALVERCCRHAQRFADGLREAGYEVLNDVVLNQVLVCFGTAEMTEEVIRRIQEDGICWCGGTVWHGKTAMRISVSNWATTSEDVDESLRAIVRAAQAASADPS